MTQKKLNAVLERLLDDGIKFYEVEVPDYRIVQTIVIVSDLEFEIARRPTNKQTLVEGEDWILSMNENATLQKDSMLLTSKLNFIHERQINASDC